MSWSTIQQHMTWAISVLSITSRPYAIKDEPACLAVFDSNVPHFFAVDERSQYVEFLASPVLEHFYLVLQARDAIVGCGGLQVMAEKKTAFFSWGMIAGDYHGKGLGRSLAEARLNQARSIPEIETITLNTSQHTKGFYEKLGFTPTKVTPNAYAPGLDRWDMICRLR
ncbi:MULTISPECIES: GNAT family N-acetyltransferase [unclassified Rhizobium]|uniref:GNAT family N-acetyltransferase n=1 Tax=unclassified Rhizobium TaxID=2613769 RepID=UPI002478B58E|nr:MULTISPECIES: GNAT family N-acetyltransferase [unclassified Rhizobium]MDH7800746.1 ribosomal protein S18 acetylase RimI-like enzyme [Rhizobium sp. AN70]